MIEMQMVRKGNSPQASCQVKSDLTITGVAFVVEREARRFSCLVAARVVNLLAPVGNIDRIAHDIIGSQFPTQHPLCDFTMLDTA